jgi:hypothetical protein
MAETGGLDVEGLPREPLPPVCPKVKELLEAILNELPTELRAEATVAEFGPAFCAADVVFPRAGLLKTDIVDHIKGKLVEGGYRVKADVGCVSTFDKPNQKLLQLRMNVYPKEQWVIGPASPVSEGTVQTVEPRLQPSAAQRGITIMVGYKPAPVKTEEHAPPQFSEAAKALLARAS